MPCRSNHRARSKAVLACGEQPSEYLLALHGDLADPGAVHIEAARPQLVQPVWGPDGAANFIVQTLDERPVAAPRRVALVIDGCYLSLQSKSLRTAAMRACRRASERAVLVWLLDTGSRVPCEMAPQMPAAALAALNLRLARRDRIMTVAQSKR